MDANARTINQSDILAHLRSAHNIKKGLKKEALKSLQESLDKGKDNPKKPDETPQFVSQYETTAPKHTNAVNSENKPVNNVNNTGNINILQTQIFVPPMAGSLKDRTPEPYIFTAPATPAVEKIKEKLGEPNALTKDVEMRNANIQIDTQLKRKREETSSTSPSNTSPSLTKSIKLSMLEERRYDRQFPPLKTQNRYQPLSDLEDTEISEHDDRTFPETTEDEGRRQPPKNKETLNTKLKQTTNKQTQRQVSKNKEEQRQPPPPKELKPPPIILKGVAQTRDGYLQLKQQITECTKKGHKMRFAKFTTILLLEDFADYDTCCRMLKREKNNEWHTYALPSEKTHAFVIKGLDNNPDIEELRAELYHTHKIEVKQIFKMNKTVRPKYLVITSAKHTLSELQRNVKFVTEVGITWERRNNEKLITQCKNCQQWGHAASNCFRKKKCMICAEEHTTVDCTATAYKCANCGKQHKANSEDCEVYLYKISKIGRPAEKVTEKPKYIPAPQPKTNAWTTKMQTARASGGNAAGRASASTLHRQRSQQYANSSSDEEEIHEDIQARRTRTTDREQRHRPQDRPRNKPALAAFCAHSVSISIGICQGYSAVWLPQLETSKDFVVTSVQSSWLASLGAISNPIGSVLSGVLAELLGRKRSIQISSFPFILGWLLIGLAQDINWLYAGRVITGIAAGMSTASYTYVGEIATPSTRGFLQTLGPICASFGILLTYVLGYLMYWKTVALISVVFAIFSMVSMQVLPESPPHLLKTHRGSFSDNSEAFKAYFFFSRNVVTAQHEIKNSLNKGGHENQPEKSLKELYLSPETVRPFCLLVVLFLLQELSGIYTILYYAVQFFGETDLQINDYVSSITVGMIRFLMSIVCAFLINKLGRKTLCSFSSFGMTLSVLILGLYVRYYEINSSEEKILRLLPLFCVIFNVLFSMIGMLPIPWILVGEMFPLRVRPIMAGVVICIAQCFVFICVKIYYDMVDYLNFSGTIFTFFIASALSMLFCKYILPETKDKSLDEIEAYFRGTKEHKNFSNTQGIDNSAFTISSENITVVTR